MNRKRDLTDEEYQALASFRLAIRRFLHFSQDRAREADLNPAQHQALLALRAAPGRRLSIGDLGRQLLLKAHTASELATRLTNAGLAIRVSGTNARERMLEITRQGERCLTALAPAHRDEVRRMKPILGAIMRQLGEANEQQEE